MFSKESERSLSLALIAVGTAHGPNSSLWSGAGVSPGAAMARTYEQDSECFARRAGRPQPLRTFLPFAQAFQAIHKSLTVVPSGTCSVAYADEVALSSFSPAVDAAITQRPGLQSWIAANSVLYAIDVALDSDQPSAYLDVVCDSGYTTFAGFSVTDAQYVGIYLQLHGLSDPDSPTGISYGGIPVETSTITDGGLQSQPSMSP